MSPPLSGVEGLKEHNYLRLSDCSSVDSSSVAVEKNKNLNLKATELRLGLPGSQSPERDSDISLLDEKQLFPLVPSKDGIYSLSGSGNKRGFADTVDGDLFNSDAGQPKLAGNDAINTMLLDKASGAHPSIKTEVPENGSEECNVNSSNTNSAPAAKAQVVGWPPIRSFRKNTLATTSKNNDEVDGTPGLFVKVSMDGAPYLRKVDLRTYSTYQQLSSALQKMFSSFTIGQPSREILRDLLHGSEYVVTYEDKDGDWMLVGDVPWKMFTASCKRLKIMKGSDAIGLAPRAMEKSKNQN